MAELRKDGLFLLIEVKLPEALAAIIALLLSLKVLTPETYLLQLHHQTE